VVKLLVGLLKGAVIGGAVGYGAYALANATGFGNGWLTYGVVGMFVGLLVGRPLWSLIRDKSATTWVGVLKAAFGFGIGCGLYAIIAKAWAPSALDVGGQDLFSWPPYLGGMIGAVYGGFVELDDAVGDDKEAPKTSSTPPGGPAKKAP
jgi:Na+/proline symporter